MTEGDFPIPARLNLLLLFASSAACAGLLWVASHAAATWQVIVAALAFSFTGNTVFSLLHEAVHGVLHPNPVLNRLGGMWAAAFFPTAFSLQRGFHLTHHRNNRSEAERFDYIQRGEIRWLKFAQWYAILTGVYWFVSVLGVVTYFLVPGALRSRSLRAKGSTMAGQTASREYLAVFDDLHPLGSRGEILFSMTVQLGLCWALDASWVGWLACYAAFGFHWSSLQYADHAFSPLDARDGAWNLRVNRFTCAMFLNYHYHLAHHQRPRVPWIHLPRLVSDGQTRPRFLTVWLSMWRGPRPLPEQGSS